MPLRSQSSILTDVLYVVLFRFLTWWICCCTTVLNKVKSQAQFISYFTKQLFQLFSFTLWLCSGKERTFHGNLAEFDLERRSPLFLILDSRISKHNGPQRSSASLQTFRPQLSEKLQREIVKVRTTRRHLEVHQSSAPPLVISDGQRSDHLQPALPRCALCYFLVLLLWQSYSLSGSC